MIRVVLVPLIWGLLPLLVAADPLAGMDQAFAKIPPRAQQVIEISKESTAIASTTFNPAAAEDFKRKYAKLQTAETEITNEISNLAGLSDQIKVLHQQTAVKKGEEERNIQILNVQVTKLAADVTGVNEQLVRLDRDLAQADRDLAEATRKLAEAERKKKRRRRRWRWFPPAQWIVRLVDHLKKEVPKRRSLRNSVANNRNRVAAQRSATIKQHQQFLTQLENAKHNLVVNDNLLTRINTLLNRGNVSKEQLVEMQLYMGRLHPHMQVISEHLAEIEQLGQKTPEHYMTILKDSLIALQQFNVAQQGELIKFQQIAG